MLFSLALVFGLASSSPSIVVLQADDLGIGDVGSYNPARHGDTPNIDRLAAEGLRLLNYRAMSPECSPSRASFLVGREASLAGYPSSVAGYPSKIYVDERGLKRQLDGDAVGRLNETWASLPHVLKGAGYQTSLFGKWHLGCTDIPPPSSYGWDRAAVWQAGLAKTWPTYGNQQFELLWTDKHRLNELIAADAKTAIDSAGDSPFFVLVNSPVPAAPLSPRREHMEAVGPMACDLDAFWHRNWSKRIIMTWENEVKSSSACVERVYRASVYSFDVLVGDVVDAVKRSQRGDDDTLVMVVSDNGPDTVTGSLGKWSQVGTAWPHRGYKRSLYEGGIRVPCIVHWPGHYVPGSKSSIDVVAVDILPTFSLLAGASSLLGDRVELDKVDLSGRVAIPLVPSISTTSSSEDKDILVWEWGYPSFGPCPDNSQFRCCSGSSPSFAVRARDDPLKLMVEFPSLSDGPNRLNAEQSLASPTPFLRTFARAELYNLTEDPGEARDLLAGETPGKMWIELAAPLASHFLRWYLNVMPSTKGERRVSHPACPRSPILPARKDGGVGSWPTSSSKLPCDLCHDHNWLFVMASGRSGSTAVMDMLNAIPGVVVVGENAGIVSNLGENFDKFISEDAEWFKVPYGAWWQNSYESLDRLVCSIQSFARDVVGYTDDADDEPQHFVGWKEIRYSTIADLDRMNKMFPCAKFIVNYRESIDTQVNSGFFSKRSDRDTLFASLVERNVLYRNWAASLGSDRVFTVTTEHIDAPTFNGILSWLGYSNCSFSSVVHSNKDLSDVATRGAIRATIPDRKHCRWPSSSSPGGPPLDS